MCQRQGYGVKLWQCNASHLYTINPAHVLTDGNLAPIHETVAYLCVCVLGGGGPKYNVSHPHCFIAPNHGMKKKLIF